MEEEQKSQIEDSGEVLDTGRFNNHNDNDKNSESENLEENVPESSCDDENEEEPSNPFEKMDYNEKIYDLPL